MIALDPRNPTAPFEQIRSQTADLIRSGELAPGQRLPSVRQLAADLGVAPGTVAKAYGLLEAEALISTSRTRGTHVAEGQQHSAGVRTAAERYVASVSDLSLEQAISAVRAAWPTERP